MGLEDIVAYLVRVGQCKSLCYCFLTRVSRTRQVPVSAHSRCGQRATKLANVQRLLCEHAFQPVERIRPDNVKKLELEWVWQANDQSAFKFTPLVVDGVMYLTDPPGDALAIDTREPAVVWRDIITNCLRILPHAAAVSIADSRSMGTRCSWGHWTRT